MDVFENCTVLLDLKNIPFKEKKRLRTAVTEHGGSICLLVNEQCTFVVTSNVSKLSQLRRIQKHQTPVVGIDYVDGCVDAGALLPVEEHRLDINATESPAALRTVSEPLTQEVVTSTPPLKPVEAVGDPAPIAETSLKEKRLDKYRTYTETDFDLPSFPDDFQVAKYCIFKMENCQSWCVLELQSCSVGGGRQYRVVRYWMEDILIDEAAVKDIMVFLDTSEEALECFKFLKGLQMASGMQQRSELPVNDHRLGSAPLQQLLLEDKLSTGQLSSDVAKFVNMLWCAALSRLTGFISAPVERLSLNDVNRAEGLLLRAHRQLKDGDHGEVKALLDEVPSLLQSPMLNIAPNLKRISATLDLCQLLRDILNLNEVAVVSTPSFSLGKYRALRCSIDEVSFGTAEYKDVAALLDGDVKIHQVMRVCRGVELRTFKGNLSNVRPLLHASVPSNFVGILSRGLLLPHVGVEKFGVERTDAGNLGSGIYFSDAFRACLKYTKRHTSDGTRLLLVCDVALGKCKDMRKRDLTLTQAPDGFHSVHGVRSTPSAESDFEDDEYVVYSPDQVKLKYVVLFNMEGDLRWDSRYEVDMDKVMSSFQSPPADELFEEVDGVQTVRNPLDKVTAGLLDSAGQRLPLQAVHVKCKLMDLLSQVVIFQKYTNQSAVPIEAKYVFPLGECAAVCGFEAFINGKHVVGQVKEKETARKEYKKAIEKGHGAYLMDQDAPDVFTISVGNLPPAATVLIKVTFVSELIVRDGSILFTLPGSVAPWQESAALNQTTQVSVEKVCVGDAGANQREFTLDASVEMPFEINSLNCITHNVKIKRTDCKAVVSVLPGQALGVEGFQLSVSLSQAHLPRMWVEKHPDKMSQACMLVFYPEFDMGPRSACEEVVIMLDTSESMKGEPLRLAQRVAMQVLQTLDASIRVNIVLFGTDYSEVFWVAQPLSDVHKEATYAIRRLHPRGGSTELWRPLQALNLLPPSRGLRNLLLLSDGHIQNAALTLQLVRDGIQHSRLFTCGLSSTANRHMLRALAEAGGGAFEFFDEKTKHNWAEKVANQVKRMASPGCSSVSVKWQQFSSDAPVPVQAPKQLHALFNDCHTLVYGFVPHCTQATLLGDLSGQEVETIVSTTELQKTSGTFLHKLTARALIQDFEDGNLESNEVEHEEKKAELKRYIVELSKEFSILSQFTSFVAIEERDSGEEGGFTDIPQLIADEDVDFLPYVSWPSDSPEASDMEMLERGDFAHCDIYYDADVALDDCDEFSDSDDDMGFSLEDGPSPHYSPTSADSLESSQVKALFRSSSHIECCLDVDALDLSSNSSKVPKASVLASWRPLGSLPPLMSPLCAAASPPLLKDELTHTARYLPEFDFHSVDLTDDSPLVAYSSLSFRAAPPPPRSRAVYFGASSPPLTPPICAFLDSAAPPPLPPAALFGAAPPPPPPRISAFLDSAAAPPPPPPAALFGAAHLPPPPPISAILKSAAAPPPAATFGPVLPSPSFFSSAGPHSMSARSGAAPKGVKRFHGFHQPTPQGGLFGSSSSMAESSHLALGGHSAPMRPYNKSKFICLAPAEGPPDLPLVEGASLTFDNDAQLLPEMEEEQQEEEPVRYLEGFSSRATSYKRRLRITKLQDQQVDTVVARGDRLQDLLESRSGDPNWTEIFLLQHSDGYWEPTAKLGELINVDFHLFVDVFLQRKGIRSLGVKAQADIVRLVATLLVLQFMRVNKLEEGELLRTLFSLEEPALFRPSRWQAVKRAVDWARWADRQYPCIYSRLEFGFNWDSSTRQLLGYDSVSTSSPLSSLDLQGGSGGVPVY